MKPLKIGYFYNDLLNLYGDTGNIEILAHRARRRGFKVEVVNISVETKLNATLADSIDLVFMGGGPDSGQKLMYDDLRRHKASFLRDFIDLNKPALLICGSYQLLGHFYKAADGSILDGLGIFDLYTQHFGKNRPRCIGNTYGEIAAPLATDPVFTTNNMLGTSLVGFENHGGRTYLGKSAQPFAKIIKGHGNNSDDGTEGVLYKSAIGTYFHGPILSRNPHIADYLIAKALNLSADELFSMPRLDDSLVISAHNVSKRLKQ